MWFLQCLQLFNLLFQKWMISNLNPPP
eukprot:UN06446